MEGFQILESAWGPRETMDRLESIVRERGLTVFARIDHAAGAGDVGLSLRPTEVLIFGSARAGTPLMSARQTIGIDLPLKALVWQDADHKTWIGYNDPAWIVARHGADAAVQAMAVGMSSLMATVAQAAAAP